MSHDMVRSPCTTSESTSSQLLGLLPPHSENLFHALPKTVTKLKTSVIRVCTEASRQLTPTAIFKDMRESVMRRWPGATIAPIVGAHKSIIGMTVTSGDYTYTIAWGGEAPNLERGMVVAEVALDRPKEQIASIKPLALEDRYVLVLKGNGSTTPDLSREQIATLQEATREARAQASQSAPVPAQVQPESRIERS